MSKREDEDNLIRNLKDAGFTPDQIFQLLMEKEKTLQKQEERKIKELEISTSTNQLSNNSNQENSKKRTIESSNSLVLSNLIKKAKPNKTCFMDLCDDEILLIFEYLSNFCAFKMSRLSKRLYGLVERVNSLHLINNMKGSAVVQFLRSRYFANIQRLDIDFEIKHSLAEAILFFCSSNGLKELVISIDKESDDTLAFSEFNSSFKTLEKLQVDCGENYTIKLDKLDLFNLKELTIYGACCSIYYYLNSRVNNITKLHLERVEFKSSFEIELYDIAHLTIMSSSLSKVVVVSLLNNSRDLKYVHLEDLDAFEDEEDELKDIDSRDSLHTLIIRNVVDIYSSLMFKTEMPALTNLTVEKLTTSDANILAKNTSIECLENLKIEKEIDDEVISLLVKSQTFFKKIESIVLNISDGIDSQFLVHISNNPNLFNHLTELVLQTREGELEGYKAFFQATHISNLRKLCIDAPFVTDDLMFLADAKNLPKLTWLAIHNQDCYPDKFFTNFTQNSNFKKLKQLELYFIDDSGIEDILLSSIFKELKKIVFSEDNVTAWGLKQLEERGLKWETFEEMELADSSDEEEEEEEEE